MSDRQVGVVTWFDKNKGYGFIRRHSGEDVVFHRNSVAGYHDLSLGQQVSFSLSIDEENYKALDVTAI